MKKIIISLFMLFLLVGVNCTELYASPVVVIKSCQIDGGAARPGEKCTLRIVLSNINSKKLSNIKVSLVSDGEAAEEPEIYINSGVQSAYIAELAAGDEYELLLDCTASSLAVAGNHTMRLVVDYQYEGFEYQTKDTVIIKIESVSGLEVYDAILDKKTMMVTEENRLNVSLSNSGNCDIHNITLGLEGDTILAGTTFIGALGMEEQTSATLAFTGNNASLENKTATIVVTYMDAQNVSHTIKQDIAVNVKEYTEGTYSQTLYNRLRIEESNEGEVRDVIKLIVIAVLLVGCTYVVIRLIKTKKKEEK